MSNLTNKGEKKRRERIPLPFEYKKVDPVDWVYSKRIGLLVMVAVYLFIGIVIVSTRISVGAKAQQEFILMEFEQVEQQQDQQELERQQRLFEQMFENVQNTVSNDNAELNAELRDAAGTQASDIYREAEAVQARMRQNRDDYMRGLQEDSEIANSRPDANEGRDEKVVERKVEGNVTVSFSLKGRSARYLHIPAYQCENGGAVTINIIVNQNGDVISASVDRTDSTTDVCLREMATNAARRSTFNADPSASARQEGSISYIFIPQ